MRVLLLSRYARLGASSRLRSFQFLPYLASRDINVVVAPFFGDDYVLGLYGGRFSFKRILRSYVTRIWTMLRAGKYNLIWVEKEFLPWIPGLIELGFLPNSVPLVADYDDAIFHRYDKHRLSVVRQFLGTKIDSVMRRADLVIAGNDYLGAHAKKVGAKRVAYVPTVIDSSRYTESRNTSPGKLTIGWIGSPGTARYLKLIAPTLQEIVSCRSVRVVAVGANPEQLADLPIEVKPWSEQREVGDIQQFDIGIMPLTDEPFERGKCGYKLIQYMACGKPVVASPVGVNSVIVRHGVEGFLATKNTDWREYLLRLCDDAALRNRMGAAGRVRVEREYSLDVVAPRLEELLRSAAK